MFMSTFLNIIQDYFNLNLFLGVSVYHLDRSPCNHTNRSPWALKTINRQLIGTQLQKRLESEAKILQELKHPNIVGFRGFSKTEDGRKVKV